MLAGVVDNSQYEQAILTPVTDGLLPLSNDAAYPVGYGYNYLKQVEEVEKIQL